MDGSNSARTVPAPSGGELVEYKAGASLLPLKRLPGFWDATYAKSTFLWGLLDSANSYTVR